MRAAPFLLAIPLGRSRFHISPGVWLYARDSNPPLSLKRDTRASAAQKYPEPSHREPSPHEELNLDLQIRSLLSCPLDHGEVDALVGVEPTLTVLQTVFACPVTARLFLRGMSRDRT